MLAHLITIIMYSQKRLSMLSAKFGKHQLDKYFSGYYSFTFGTKNTIYNSNSIVVYLYLYLIFSLVIALQYFRFLYYGVITHNACHIDYIYTETFKNATLNVCLIYFIC